MYVSDKKSVSQINFLASSKFQAFTVQVPVAMGVTNAQGQKIVPAGTVFPANDATATGILYNEVDVTYGPQPGSNIVEGYILKDRLPVVPAAAAITALKEIKFR